MTTAPGAKTIPLPQYLVAQETAETTAYTNLMRRRAEHTRMTLIEVEQLRAAAVVEQQDMERAKSIPHVVDLLVAGRPGRARYELARSVMRQARYAGLGDIPVRPVCPCGHVCPGRA